MKSILRIVCLLCLVAVIQTGAAIYFAKRTVRLEPADLVVVFPGDSRRIITGIDLVKDDLAPRFMVTSTTAPHLRELLAKNGASENIDTLPGGESRSTFEDVYQTIRTIEDNQLQSAILVTSSYHLPRAMFLLRVSLGLAGQDVRIQGFSVKEEEGLSKNLVQYPTEAIKLWGSIIEMTGQYVSGRLLLDAPILKKVQRTFKETFLLNA
jgi:uncharacterized SAM-binding protein YcdF (DUF218 family)